MDLAYICPVHGSRPFRGPDFGQANNITFLGVHTVCEECGRSSRIVDGTFDYNRRDGLSVVSAPRWSIDALTAIGAIVAETRSAIQDPQLAPAAVIARTNEGLSRLAQSGVEGAPYLAEQVRQAIRTPKTPKQKAAVAVAALGLVATFLANYADAREGLDKLVEDVRGVSSFIEEARSEPTSTVVPGETPGGSEPTNLS
jgi:hypothetical protein